MPTREEIRQSLVDHIRLVKPSVGASTLNPQVSLTGDLGLGSMDLIHLSNSLTRDFPGLDLTPWLAQACNPRMDTVESLVSYLSEQIKEQ
ncbi:MAG TPA: hypothetical protein VIU15_23845 [Streptomyces sp.]